MSKQLYCTIVDFFPARGMSSANYHYQVADEDGTVVAKGVSSSRDWVRHDAGGYHTKAKFDQMYPDGWHVIFDF